MPAFIAKPGRTRAPDRCRRCRSFPSRNWCGTRGRAARHIDGDARQRLVHRQVDIGIARNAALVAERLPDRLAERNAGILDRVMVVDMGVARDLHGEIDQRMAREQVEHMVEKADTGADGRLSGAIQHQAHMTSVSLVRRLTSPRRSPAFMPRTLLLLALLRADAGALAGERLQGHRQAAVVQPLATLEPDAAHRHVAGSKQAQGSRWLPIPRFPRCTPPPS